MNCFAGRVVLITGGARGQGESHAEAFVNVGASVVLGDILDADGEACAKRLGPTARYVHLDVTQEDDWARAVTLATVEFGGVDILVNNAGIQGPGDLADYPIERLRNILDVNVVGQVIGIKAVLPSMRSRGGGSIINISSAMGLRGAARSVAYVASKFAVTGLTKAAAMDVGADGIRVNSVHPGYVKTPMVEGTDEIAATAKSNQPIRRFARPDEVSALVMYLASDESAFCTGAEFVIDGGISTGLNV